MGTKPNERDGGAAGTLKPRGERRRRHDSWDPIGVRERELDRRTAGVVIIVPRDESFNLLPAKAGRQAEEPEVKRRGEGGTRGTQEMVGRERVQPVGAAQPPAQLAQATGSHQVYKTGGGEGREGGREK